MEASYGCILIISFNFFFLDQIKTSGLVVWTRKDVLVVYRGTNYHTIAKSFQKMHPGLTASAGASNSKLDQANVEDEFTVSNIKFCVHTTDEKLGSKDDEEDSSPTGMQMVDSQPVNGSLYEREADRLLDGLGPRFIDWWRPKPLPVDADLLPEVIPGYRPPLRSCAPHVRAKLTADELMYLRRLAYVLPTHFVLGNQIPSEPFLRLPFPNHHLRKMNYAVHHSYYITVTTYIARTRRTE